MEFLSDHRVLQGRALHPAKGPAGDVHWLMEKVLTPAIRVFFQDLPTIKLAWRT